MTTVYVTKWWLSKGLVKAETETPLDQNMIFIRGIQGPWGDHYLHKPDWHASRGEAGLYAEQLRVKRMASLKKQLAKLKAMTFTIPEGKL
jgi:hypothetical protein